LIQNGYLKQKGKAFSLLKSFAAAFQAARAPLSTIAHFVTEITEAGKVVL
jgi:hypothetical protein